MWTLPHTWHGLVYDVDVASIRKLPSGHYRVRWRDAEGDEIGATAPTKKAALELKAQAELNAFRGVHRDPKAGRRAFGPYLTELLDTASDLRPATLELYRTQARRYVIPRLGGRAVAAIDTADLRRLYASLGKSGVGVPTIENVHRLISRALAHAVEDGLIAVNPAARARAPRANRKPVTVLAPKEAIWLADILQHYADFQGSQEQREIQLRRLEQRSADFTKLPTDPDRLDYFAHLMTRGDSLAGLARGYGVMALLGMFAGLRFGEAAALRRSRLKLDGADPRIQVLDAATEVRGVVTIGPPKTPRSIRTVPIAGKLASILETHLAGLDGRDDSLIFVTAKGLPLSRTRFAARIWRPSVELAKLAHHPTFHDLRHSYAAWLISLDRHAKEIQELMGHTSVRTTLDVYGHLMESASSHQHERMDEALGVARGTPVARRVVAVDVD
jgi:integrase